MKAQFRKRLEALERASAAIDLQQRRNRMESWQRVCHTAAGVPMIDLLRQAHMVGIDSVEGERLQLDAYQRFHKLAHDMGELGAAELMQEALATFTGWHTIYGENGAVISLPNNGRGEPVELPAVPALQSYPD